MKFTKEEISEIVGLKDGRGQLLNIFDLHGKLFLAEHGSSRYVMYNSHSLPIIYSDFEWCQTEDNVMGQFLVSLREAVNGKLF